MSRYLEGHFELLPPVYDVRLANQRLRDLRTGWASTCDRIHSYRQRRGVALAYGTCAYGLWTQPDARYIPSIGIHLERISFRNRSVAAIKWQSYGVIYLYRICSRVRCCICHIETNRTGSGEIGALV